jgi:GT2 family glycosyltransferase
MTCNPSQEASLHQCQRFASIIIVCYNGQNYLHNCLSSVLSDVEDTCEIIVVDNASNDGSVQLIREYYPEVRLIENKKNIGFAAACNQGARESKTEILVFLNQDTQVCPGWLSGLTEPLERAPMIGLVTSKLVLMSDPSKLNACGQDIHFSGMTFLRGLLQECDSSAFQKCTAVDAVSGASFAIHRNLWQKLGGFDELLFMYYEETDLSWRAKLVGAACIYAPDSIVLHDYHPGKPSLSSLIYSKRNRYILLLKNWRWTTLFILLPGLFLTEMVDWGHSIFFGRRGIRAKVLAYRRLITLWPQVIEKRRNVQNSRSATDATLLRAMTSHLSPTEIRGGCVGNIAIGVLNLLLKINCAIALKACKLFNR